MKNSKLFILIMILLSYDAIGQHGTLRYVDDRNIWQMSSPQWFSPAREYQISFSKDSIRLGDKYYVEEIFDDKNNPGWNGTGIYYREQEGKIYSWNGQNEELQYNFNLVVGDSIQASDLSKLMVKAVEYIVTEDGLTRKKIVFNVICNGLKSHDLVWIEGIGEPLGRFLPSQSCIIFDPSPSMDCFYQNDIKVFSSGHCYDPNAYKKLVSSDYIWQVDVTRDALPEITQRLYRFGPLKIINGKMVNELLQSEGHKPTLVSWSGTGMYFRQEGNKVYFLQNGEEILYFDFNLIKGDTFDLQYGPKTKVNVVKTDTIILLDNKPRKRLYLACDALSEHYEVIWIEGIGDLSSFLFSYVQCTLFDPAEFLDLRCVLLTNYKEIFHDNDVQGCFIADVFSPLKPQIASIRIYPNPAEDMITIESSHSMTGYFMVTDISGQIKNRLSMSSELLVSLNVAELNDGIYFYHMILRDGTNLTGKFIKH
ncbi:MAG: T9SS type A sorting domain-containing protein [Saprospiraceae bacterium]|nr:T9SS type A sorting domain-containing protein [Saprospiraceae bacterium]